MVRSILAAVAGYTVIVVVVVAGIGLTWTALGSAGAFTGEGPQPSPLWMISNLVSGFVAALAGGWVARRIGRSMTAVKILVGLILALGLVSAVIGGGQAAEESRIDKPVAELTFTEAGQYAQQPDWYDWVIPVIGALGAWMGGQRKHEER